jgi:aryl-alcohol dehydrogenase-like predicted oxidoreductase
MTDPDKLARVRALEPIAKELSCTLSQLSIAWILKNPNVSTVITGASRVEQVHENLKAGEVAPRITPEILLRMDEIFGIKKEEED